MRQKVLNKRQTPLNKNELRSNYSFLDESIEKKNFQQFIHIIHIHVRFGKLFLKTMI
jgi:hypothetical protein